MPTTMTLTEALSRIKTLGKQIDDLLAASALTGVETDGKIGGRPSETVTRELAARVQALTALITNRTRLVAALLVANAGTQVTVGKETMLIAAAISRKNEGQERLPRLQQLYAQLTQMAEATARHNDRLREQAQVEAVKLPERDRASSLDATVEQLVQRRRQTFVDPGNLIATLPNQIRDLQEFLDTVDAALAVANATNTLMVDFG